MKISKILIRQSAVITALGLLALQSASSYAARCEYIIQNEWNNGFVAAVRITNDTSTVINSWAVNWNYTDGTRHTGSWNASLSGNNPYTATGVGWNNRINPGQSVEFGVQGSKGVANSPAQKPIVTGAVCNTAISSSSVASSSIRSSSSSSVISSSSSSIVISPSSSSIRSSSISSVASSQREISSTSTSLASWNSTSSSSTTSSLISSSSLRSSSSISSSASSPLSSSSSSRSSVPTDTQPYDNPFIGARWYVDPIWSEKAKGEVGGDKIARFNTAVWMDRIGAIDPAEGFGLRDHLDAALEQGANLIQVVVYDLPNRDCHALASNGELAQGPNGTLRYRTEYVDALAAIFSDS